VYKDEEDSFVRIWEDEEKSTSARTTIVGVGVFSPPGEGHIDIHPEYRHIERNIISWLEGEATHKTNSNSNARELSFFVREDNRHLITLLEEFGYENRGLYSHDRVRQLDCPIPNFELPQGMEIRSVDIVEELEEYRAAEGSVFTHCLSMTMENARIFKSASFYNPDLDIAVVTEKGEFAAFCTIRIDPVSGIAEFEPVGTRPGYRRRGLAKMLIAEGLRRAEDYDITYMCIPGANPTEAASRLYEAMGFELTAREYHWSKILS
jgi:ribosomal protein S18 acetylase RimI-like enzyme